MLLSKKAIFHCNHRKSVEERVTERTYILRQTILFEREYEVHPRHRQITTGVPGGEPKAGSAVKKPAQISPTAYMPRSIGTQVRPRPACKACRIPTAPAMSRYEEAELLYQRSLHIWGLSCCSLISRRNKAIPNTRLRQQVAWMCGVVLQLLAQPIDIHTQILSLTAIFRTPDTL